MSLTILDNVPLAPETTLKIGGNAQYFTTVTTVGELTEAVQHAQEHSLAVTILGGGSNVLIEDVGIKGLVIKNCISERSVDVQDTIIELTVGAGETLDEVVAYTVASGWWGIENWSHIPGSVGAVPIQNVGAYGLEAQDVVRSVEVFDMATNTVRVLKNSACNFGYRDSIFKQAAGANLIVTHVVFELTTEPSPRISYRDLAELFSDTETVPQADIRQAVIDIRAQKFPDWNAVGTAGSFFKNPVIATEKYAELKETYPELPGFAVSETATKIPLGYVLDKVCGLRGYERGNVSTYAGQALVMVHNGNANSTEITAFANDIAAQVYEKTGVEIEWEVTRLPQ